ncbi:MAG: tetratricopeptide repeat protein [Elusimicrobia bacterium]|nr:tetratricopeptide repeat protein [Elusimicrobiota bacterium]
MGRRRAAAAVLAVFCFPGIALAQDALKAAQELYDRGEYSSALGYYERYIKQNPKDPKAQSIRFMIAECALKARRLEADSSGRTDRSLSAENKIASLFLETVNIEPKSYLAEGAQFRVNEMFFNTGLYSEAAQSWDKFLDKYEGSYLRGEALLAMAHTQAARGQFDEAQFAVDELLRYNPAYQEGDSVRYLTGLLAFAKRDWAAAIENFEKLTRQTDASLYYAAKSYASQGRALFAAAKFQELINRYPGSSFVEESAFLLADAYFAAQDFAGAVRRFESFLETYSTGSFRWAAHYKIGASYFAEEDYLAAREALQTVLEGPSAGPAGELALHHGSGRLPGSIAQNGNEFVPWALYLIGESYLKEKRFREAGYALSKMANTFPAHSLAANALYKLSWCFIQDSDLAAAESNLRQLAALYPNHSILSYGQLLLGRILRNQGKYAEAARAYQKSIDLTFPGEVAEAAMALASQVHYLGDNDAALVSGYHLLVNNFPPAANPWRAWSYLFVAEGYFKRGHYREAADIYEAIIKAYPSSPAWPHAQNGLAWSFFKMGRFSEALGIRDKILKMTGEAFPADLLLVNDYERGNVLFNLKRYSDALEQFERFGEKNSGHDLAPEAKYRIGLCYAQLGYHGQSLEVWEALRKTHAGSEAAMRASWMIADTYFRAAKYDAAVGAYQQIIEANPKDSRLPQARLRIAQSHYNNQKFPEAMEAFQSLIVNHPDTPEAKEGLDFLASLLERAELRHLAQDRLHNAAAFLGASSKLGAEAQFIIAQSYFTAGDWAHAAEDLEKLGIAGFDAERLALKEYYAGESYYQLGKWKNAVRAFERLVKNFPQDERVAFALFRLGASYFKLENFRDAAQYFEALAQNYPKSDQAASAMYNAAMSYKSAKTWTQAENAFLNYMRKFPDKAKETGAREELAAVYEEQKKYGDAAMQLDDARKEIGRLEPRYGEMSFKIAELRVLGGQDDAAIQTYELLLEELPAKNEWRLSALIKLGELYEKNSRWQDAIRVYDLLVKDAVKPEWVQAGKARAEFIKTNHPEIFGGGKKTGPQGGN